MIFQPNSIKIRDQQTIQITFTSAPAPFITKANINIISTFLGVQDLEILSIDIVEDIITIITRPQFPNNLYLIQLLDISTQAFIDVNNIELSTFTDARNIYFLGVEDINIVRDDMLANLPANYDISEQTLVRDLTSVVADEINKTNIALHEIANDNFISVSVVDEKYSRGPGPTDRLANEGTYRVSRVAKTITGTHAAGLKTFDPILNPNIIFEIINLRVLQIEESVPDNTSANKFDGFLITLSHSNITKLISLTLSPENIEYFPNKYGYALANNNYDRFAKKSFLLKSNQILLSSLTNNEFPEPIQGDTMSVIYEYDNAGRKVDKTSISLFSVINQTNEKVPPTISIFFLQFANIVDENGNTISNNGVRFNKSTIDLSKHAAFIREIIFNQDILPSSLGEYAINYQTGQVFVYGTGSELGTTSIPPVATYFYKDIAISNTDYFINDDGYNISLNSFSRFATQQFSISFLYEDFFTPDIDYIASSHVEVLNERIDNKLISDFAITTNYGPVKEVYQILNETTGETYTPGFFEGNKVFFNGNIPPHTSSTIGELGVFGIIDDELLNIGIETITPNKTLRVFSIALKQNTILNQRNDGIGSSFNTSIQFTKIDLFLNEYYFNPFDNVQFNLEKLLNIGDYIVDYATGNIYIAVSNGQGFDIGHTSYAYGIFIPKYKHVLDVSSIGIGLTSSYILQDFNIGYIKDGIIAPEKLKYGYDTFDGHTQVPNTDQIFVAQLQDDFTLYTQYPIQKVYSVFTQNDVNVYSATDIVNKNLFDSSINSFNNTIIDLKTYVILPVENDINPNYFSVVIDDDVAVVKSIVVVDTNIELLDTQLHIIKYNNIIIKSIVPFPSINPTTANIVMQNIITLINPGLDSIVDIAGNRFDIVSITGGNTLLVNVNNFIPPIINIGSEILDHNGIVIARFLNIISVLELPDMLYVLHYDVFPDGILPGYYVKDHANNVFLITDIQISSVVVVITDFSIIPITDPAAKIETDSILVSIGPGQTKLMLPLDAPITDGTNIRIGYVPKTINDSIVAATNLLSAGGTGMVVDYSIGQFFLNYRHLDDELIISYEWGDNQLDWSISDALQSNDTYYVSYNYGASRNGLETNFGSLTNVDFLQSAPLSINRETYRTAVGATIQAFLQGSTHEAFRILAHAFTQIDPDIEEAILHQWLIGRDPLILEQPINTDTIIFDNGKYNEGMTISTHNSIQLPCSSSIRLAQGTFSTWFRPNWSGTQADEFVDFILPNTITSVYFNAFGLLPQDVPANQWYLNIMSDSYGTAQAFIDYIEVRNSKNVYTTNNIPSNDDILSNNSLLLHDNLTNFPYEIARGKYLWFRKEPTLSAINDLDINFTGFVKELNYVSHFTNVIDVSTILIDDGYNKYSTGFYLSRRNTYGISVVLEDVHLSTEQPLPHFNPPIIVSTISGSVILNVISGDTSKLSIGQQIIVDIAFPELTNILGFTANTIIMRGTAQTTLTSAEITNLDPISTIGTLDGYGEIHLRNKLGNRILHTLEERTGGWEKQLLVKIQLSPTSTGHFISLGSDDPPLSTQTPIIDLLDTIIPDADILVDGYNNVFEIDHVEMPFIYIKKPSASGLQLPIGNVTTFRKVVGIKTADNVLTAIPINWSNTTSYTMNKTNGLLQITYQEQMVSCSYITHNINNTDGYSNISFGINDDNVDAIIRIQSVNYNIHPIFDNNDIYIGNTGTHPLSNIQSFRYDLSNTGIPAINTDKYFAIFTSITNALVDEPTDEVFIKIKIPSHWTLSDGINTDNFNINPLINFSATTNGDFINIADLYGMTFITSLDNILVSATDHTAYVPGNISILLDTGPELHIAAGKRHYLFDVENNKSAMRLYRSGNGFLTAEIISGGALFNIRVLLDWNAGSLHHIAMSWKISSPDKQDELHLFIDGDEVPNEISFGSDIVYGNVGEIYHEVLIIIPRMTSSDGSIINDINGSGLFIPYSASIQPDNTWIDKTIVLNSITLGPNTFLNEPLIVGAIAAVVGGNMLFLSQNNTQIDFAMYGPSTPIKYGLATHSNVHHTILTRVNFGIFKNNVELRGPSNSLPQFRQVRDSQIIEIYNVDINGQYSENIINTDIVTLQTYGLLSETIRKTIYQYGSLIKILPINIDNLIDNQLVTTNVAITGGGAFITDLPPPIDPTLVKAFKILLPRIMI